MEIKKVKFWSRSVQSENIEHVRIEYKDGDSIHVLHQFDKCAIAAPEFYDAFNNLPVYVCKMCGLGEGLKHGIFVSDVSIEKSEDKQGNDTSVYKLICKLKAGHSNASLIVSCQHKYIPEGFDQAIKILIDESNAYIGGKREQLDLFDPNNTEIVLTGDQNQEPHEGPEIEVVEIDPSELEQDDIPDTDDLPDAE